MCQTAPSRAVYSYRLTILESHLDFFGHVNNAVYLALFEEARWDMITNNGYGVKEIEGSGLGPVVLEAHVKFQRELRLRQTIIIETRLASLARMTSLLSQRMVDDVGQSYCTAEFKFGLFDLERRKLVKATEEWKRALGLD